MKFNWGTGIIITFGLFIAGVAAVIIFSFSRESELVTDNYYEKEIVYQDQIEKINRTGSLESKPEILHSKGLLNIKFPAYGSKITGRIYFYRPSDSKSDFNSEIKPDTEGNQVIDLTSLKPGYWKVSLQWLMNGEEYFLEKAIVI